MHGTAFDDLIADTGLDPVHPAAEAITQITDDSRRVTPGGLFVARGAAGGDGWRPWVAQACAAGAAAVVAPARVDTPAGVGLAVAPKTAPEVGQPLAGFLAARFFGHPARGLKLVGITGTNGKTTVATITQHLLRAAGLRCGLLGTVAVDDGGPGGPRPAELTTPGAIELQRVFARMAANGCAAAVMEVSSHALDQGRVAGLAFDAAVFTNLTQDHLDYHGTMEAYAAAKAKLFGQLADGGTAVVNAQSPHAAAMAAAVGARGATVYRSAPAGVNAADPVAFEALTLTANQSRVRFAGPWGSFAASLPLIGPYNLMNALQALTAAHALAPRGPDAWSRDLAACPAVPGRLEAVTAPGPGPPDKAPAVLVDYAHTPDALVNVLGTLRPLTTGRLICVFGCGGDRDRAKRPKMARAAADGADVLWLTSDNPRTEDPQQILDDTAAGVPADRRAALTVEIDRARAIAGAVADARAGDTVLVAGKGHEDYQIIGTEKTHFDDREEAAKALACWGG